MSYQKHPSVRSVRVHVSDVIHSLFLDEEPKATDNFYVVFLTAPAYVWTKHQVPLSRSE